MPPPMNISKFPKLRHISDYPNKSPELHNQDCLITYFINILNNKTFLWSYLCLSLLFTWLSLDWFRKYQWVHIEQAPILIFSLFYQNNVTELSPRVFLPKLTLHLSTVYEQQESLEAPHPTPHPPKASQISTKISANLVSIFFFKIFPY